MTDKKGLRQWLWERRANSRLAFLFNVGSRLFSSFLSLFWARLLVEAMGLPLNSLYIAFQSLFSFGGLGDLGMGGAVGIRTGQYLGEGQSKLAELQRFLQSARAVFLWLALIIGGGLLILSPWMTQLLSHWRQFPETVGAGPLPLVFAVGAILMAGVLLSSYISNLNYACGNVTWPIAPALILLQISLFCHWLLARQHQPLWVQYLPYVFGSVVTLWLTWFYVRLSHPPLAQIFPVKFNWPLTVSLLESSFWIYLCSLGNMIYRQTDNLVIEAGFPDGTLAPYFYNYRFCELAVFVALTASLVTLPKITQWMASSDPKDQARVRVEMRRLNQFQSLLGCGAALAYLAGNDLFMKIWWHHSSNPILPAPMPIQIAFALNMAVTASGDAGIQLSLRSGKSGLRVMGILIGLTGLLNFGLSLAAMKLGSLPGIALATVLAQSVLSLFASYFICRHLQLKWLPWAFRGWLLPLLAIGAAAWLRLRWPIDSISRVTALIVVYASLLLAAAWALGLNAKFFREELALAKKSLGK